MQKSLYRKGDESKIKNLFYICLLTVSILDIRFHRIPNWWLVLWAMIGLVYRSVGFLLPALTVTAVCFPLFLCRMTGAGDIKLMALICGYLGFWPGIWAIGYGFLAGAVFSLFRLISQKSLKTRLCYLFAYIGRIIQTKELSAYYDARRDGYENTIPLGACLALGTAVSMVLYG